MIDVGHAYPRGSEWTQWDLHIHTPATLLSNSYDGAGPDEKWSRFLAAVECSGLQVIAPTNYFCLDGLERVVEAFEAGRLGAVECVLPNIEFRINQSNKDGTHIHVHALFADHFARDLTPLTDFLSTLELFGLTADSKLEHCSRDTVSRLGANAILVEFRKLDSALRRNFTPLDDYVLVAGARGMGNFRPKQGDARADTVAIEIDRACTVIYGTAADRDHFLKLDRYEGAAAKPVFSCSDAHDCNAIGTRRTWIRANPTYEGLKQAVFEPDLRVALDSPAASKSIYSSISSVRFMTGPEHQDLFPAEPVPLNEDLTAIIGGKSTGKSLLLHYLASTIDERQTLDRECVVTGCATSKYGFDEAPGFDVEVTWSDGHQELFSNRGTSSGSRRIVYVPQRFLNGICEIEAPSGGRTLDDFTREALQQRPALRDAFDELSSAKESYRRNVAESLDRLLEHHGDREEARASLAETGDEAGVKAEIRRLDQEIRQLRDSSKMSPEERGQYETLTAQLNEVAALEVELRSDDAAISTAEDAAARAAKRMKAALVSMTSTLKHAPVKSAAEEALRPLIGLTEDVDRAFEVVRAKAKACRTDLEGRRAAAEVSLSPLVAHVEDQIQLEKLQEKKTAETARLAEVHGLTEGLRAHEEALSAEVTELAHQVRELAAAHASVCDVLALEADALGDITFTARTAFDTGAFQSGFVDAAVKKPTLKTCLGSKGTYEFVFDADAHGSYVEEVAHGLVSGVIECMKGISLRHALGELVEDRFMIDYQIEYQGDGIDSMSPGKRALVVLKILLELTDDEWPILLDQPDDDLDSRSVYRELVQYFRVKKRARQVVLVTHNPNLVVGADADCVVVANQSGQEPGRENEASRFEYVSGGLEVSFSDADANGVLQRQGIREHVCDVLEGGADAFRERERKYHIRPSIPGGQ